MGRSLITRLEWPTVDHLAELAIVGGKVRQTFCTCLDSILEDIVKDSLIHSDAISEEKVLAQDDAERATNKYIIRL